MLYATTRSKTDSYTAYRALYEDKAPDGGYFLPFRMPVYDKAQIEKMKDQSFGQTVAQILNQFFSARITAWDVDCCIGKAAAKVIAMSHRVLLVQLWNNPRGDYSYICDMLYEKLCGEKPENSVTDWGNIAVRISVLFGIYSLLDKDIKTFDVSVNSGDFSGPMAAWYARQMGLPVGTIVCACNENSAPWDFLHRGELNTGMTAVQTSTPDLDVANPTGLERLIYAVFGYEEVQKYLEISKRRGLYQIRPDMLQKISRGMFVSVVGKDRVESVISSVYRSNDCILDPYTAVSYGSLQDYRAKTGESCPTVMLWEKNPTHFLPAVQKATSLNKGDIEKHLSKF